MKGTHSYIHKSNTTACQCHAACRRWLWEDVDWPRGKGWLLLPTVHTPAVSLSERMRGETGEKEGATSPLFPSPLCISSPRAICPRSQPLLQRSAVWGSDVATSHFLHYGGRGALTQIVWPLNSSCTYKRYWNDCDLLVEKNEQIVTDLLNYHLKRQCHDSV